MRKGNIKRGFIAPQPAAQIAALDFTHQSEAFRRALAVLQSTPELEANNAALAVANEIGDRLLSIPTSDPAQIAEKVSAYAWLHTETGRTLTDQASQWAIAEGTDDAAKGLLAIYLDLGGVNDGRSL